MGRKKKNPDEMLFFILLNPGLDSNSYHLLIFPLSIFTETPGTYDVSNALCAMDYPCSCSLLL